MGGICMKLNILFGKLAFVKKQQIENRKEGTQKNLLQTKPSMEMIARRLIYPNFLHFFAQFAYLPLDLVEFDYRYGPYSTFFDIQVNHSEL